MASPIQPRNKIATSRFAYIDWMRGLACALMFQTHCYDSWLKPEARQTRFFMWSQMGGMLPAPIFIFVAGISVALITVRLREKGIDRKSIEKKTIFRLGSAFQGAGICDWLSICSLDGSFAR